MQIIYKPRQTGKTLELIKQANNYTGFIVTLNNNACLSLMALAKKHNYQINFPLTFTEFLSGKFHGKGIKKFYIDNADLLLQSLSKGVPVKAITLTEEG